MQLIENTRKNVRPDKTKTGMVLAERETAEEHAERVYQTMREMAQANEKLRSLGIIDLSVNLKNIRTANR